MIEAVKTDREQPKLTTKADEMSDPLVIYHKDCADGFGAAFAAWLELGDDADYIPWQYTDPKKETLDQEWDRLVEVTDYSPWERDIYILDFSFRRELMQKLFEVAKRVVWLDHHKTAFEMLCGGIPNNGCLRESDLKTGSITLLDNNKSGALLAWEYFHPDKEVPLLIKHIDDYDRWQFKIEGTKAFNKALWSYAPWSFEQWEAEFVDLHSVGKLRTQTLYNEGAAILRAHKANVRAVINGASRECSIQVPAKLHPRDAEECETAYVISYDNAPGLAANCPPHLASDAGHILANQSGTYGLLWYIDKDSKCKCSLRSNGDYDVSAIAKAFGGSGRKTAAGFEIDVQTLLGWIK